MNLPFFGSLYYHLANHLHIVFVESIHGHLLYDM